MKYLNIEILRLNHCHYSIRLLKLIFSSLLLDLFRPIIFFHLSSLYDDFELIFLFFVCNWTFSLSLWVEIIKCFYFPLLVLLLLRTNRIHCYFGIFMFRIANDNPNPLLFPRLLFEEQKKNGILSRL